MSIVRLWTERLCTATKSSMEAKVPNRSAWGVGADSGLANAGWVRSRVGSISIRLGGGDRLWPSGAAKVVVEAANGGCEGRSLWLMTLCMMLSMEAGESRGL